MILRFIIYIKRIMRICVFPPQAYTEIFQRVGVLFCRNIAARS